VAATAKENAPEAAQRASAAPFNALITGSTKGIGLALAKEFLRNRDNVVIYSQSEKVQNVVEELRSQFEKHGVGVARAALM
jgi:hypothetical protein